MKLPSPSGSPSAARLLALSAGASTFGLLLVLAACSSGGSNDGSPAHGTTGDDGGPSDDASPAIDGAASEGGTSGTSGDAGGGPETGDGGGTDAGPMKDGGPWLCPPYDPSKFRDDAGTYHLPLPSETPGYLCTKSDPNFGGTRYAENVAVCNRNVPSTEKDAIAAAYGGIPRADYPKYEFDHYIPLSIGGSDDPRNVWPQPIDDAHRKDTVEQTAFDRLNSGAITQAQAIALLCAWRP